VHFVIKQKPHRPGIAPALSLRAEGGYLFTLTRTMQGVNDESSSVRDFLVLPPPALIEQWKKSTKMSFATLIVTRHDVA
jgi:hypothetical protein